MNVNQELKYAQSHEWVRVEGNTAYIGISDYAQSHLGNIVFVELPEVGDQVGKGSPLAVVESVKAASDIYTPLSGTITEVNEALMDQPEEINKDPYNSWLVALELSDPTELDELMNSQEYDTFSQQEG